MVFSLHSISSWFHVCPQRVTHWQDHSVAWHLKHSLEPPKFCFHDSCHYSLRLTQNTFHLSPNTDGPFLTVSAPTPPPPPLLSHSVASLGSVVTLFLEPIPLSLPRTGWHSFPRSQTHHRTPLCPYHPRVVMLPYHMCTHILPIYLSTYPSTNTPL